MSHYFSKEQKSPLRLSKITANLRNNQFEFYTGSGVFSLKKVDKGTILLIENSTIKPNWKILDLGCGYGPVGISIAKSFPETKVLMTDVNKRAIKLAKMSIELNKTANVETKCSDKFEKIDQNFDTILLNPPQTAGKQLCFEMIEGSKSHLERNGLLQLVARHNKGGKDLSKKMNEVFGNVKETAKGSGYRIYVSEKTN
ncbi:MAG: methyltransferase [Candidatus Woesearchaeota archaeon]|jgi:16S rRNA G1207 methylase RsmC|nr:methyltransferase [Candidatus Woesearchaeota archaeon]